MSRLEAAIQGRLDEFLASELKKARNAMMRGMHEASDGLKNDLRGQTESAGLSRKLVFAWRGIVYPQKKQSLSPAGLVYSRASYILSPYTTGETIRAKNGRFLAIPTENAPKRRRGEKSLVRRYQQRRGELSFVRNPKGTPFLVDNKLVASYNRQTGAFRGYRKASKSALRSGKNLRSVVMFWLVPSVKRPKVIEIDNTAVKWQSLFPSLALKYWRG